MGAQKIDMIFSRLTFAALSPTVVSWLMMADLIWMPELVSKKARRRRESQEQQLPLQPPPKNQPLPHSQQQLPLRPQHLQQPQLQQPQQRLRRLLPRQQLLPQLEKARTTLEAATKNQLVQRTPVSTGLPPTARHTAATTITKTALTTAAMLTIRTLATMETTLLIQKITTQHLLRS